MKLNPIKYMLFTSNGRKSDNFAPSFDKNTHIEDDLIIFLSLANVNEYENNTDKLKDLLIKIIKTQQIVKA